MDQELDLMKKQFAILNEKVSKQQILSENMLNRAIKRSVSTVKRTYIIELFACLYVVTFGTWTFYEIGYSLPFLIGTIIFMVFCAAATLFVGKDILSNTMQEGTMLEVMQKAARAKKLEQNWLFIGIPLGLAWFGWICLESYFIGEYMLIYGISFGMIIGAALGYRNYKRTINALNNIVEDIKDVTEQQ